MTEYIPRLISKKVLEAHKHYPVIAMTGPRQSGKTRLCRNLFPDYHYLNLEDINTRVVAIRDPASFLDICGRTAIIDEVQNVPDLLSLIQVRVDKDPSLRFIFTGSCNFTLLERMSQSLAGRVALFTLLPFSLKELNSDNLYETDTNTLLWQGLYPGVVANGIESGMFYSNYYQTYIERDVRDLLNVRNYLKFDTFMRLLASRCGSEVNASSLARETGVSGTTISDWLSILTMSYITYAVQPYSANISKRLTKMPKIYFSDTGLLCYLLEIDSPEALSKSTLRGAIFENMAMAELLKRRYNENMPPRIFFYREHSGKEVDALISQGGQLNLYEIKSSKTYHPDYTSGMDYLGNLLPSIGTATVIYDGPSFAPTMLNIRDV